MNTFLLTATGLLLGSAIGAAVTAVFYESQISEGYVMEAEGYEDEGGTEGDTSSVSCADTALAKNVPPAHFINAAHSSRGRQDREPKYEVLTDEDWELIDEVCADELAGID